MPDVVFLPTLHSLVMDYDVGLIIFERFVRVMARISVQRGNLLAFHHFLFWEYHQGHIKSNVLARLLSECERLSLADWKRNYPLSAQQLVDFNSSQDRATKPPLSTEEFLDLNSIRLVQGPFTTWVERYKVYVAMKKELKQQQIFYPISVDQFLQHASFGTSSSYKMSLGQDEYGNFVEAQRQLHIQRMAPVMGSSYSIIYGAFQGGTRSDLGPLELPSHQCHSLDPVAAAAVAAAAPRLWRKGLGLWVSMIESILRQAFADNGEDPTEALRAVIAGSRRPRAPPSPMPNHDPPSCCGGTIVYERWGVQKKAQLSVSQSTRKMSMIFLEDEMDAAIVGALSACVGILEILVDNSDNSGELSESIPRIPSSIRNEIRRKHT
ncbi:hypothetical protein Taro_021931 [Colocasia esculenta]|uniref:Uncharacterized protein n=1 Tax=Colocasia esculenta TaxID=4460 RepID=A0A843V6G0_COLES|nr:hypothetical protein [Colocasia esculenta]